MITTTGVVDFWRFFALREAARARREDGDGPPYSDDPVLAKYHFCNVFREADAGTRWFVANRLGPAADVVWEAIVYRTVNRWATFEAWRSGYRLPFPPPTSAGFVAWSEFLRGRVARSEQVFTGRHYTRGLRRHLETLAYLLEASNLLDLVEALTARESSDAGLAGAVGALRSVPQLGDFFAWQVVLDLVDAGIVRDDPDWVVMGPGAVAGARLINPRGTPLGTARAVWASQDVVDKRAFLRPHVRLRDVEHALCEYNRYVLASRGELALEVKPWAKR